MMSSICFTPAHSLLEMQLQREISAVELLQEHRKNVDRYNDTLNAIVSIDDRSAFDTARYLDEYLSQHKRLIGPLHGLPTAIKDIFATKGLRTTYGNPYFRDHIPDYDDIVVSRERAAGAVVFGKTNTPDCASGGITKNEIFGLTLNPWNLAKTTSGSGGGGVSALMSGMVAFADGSDVGGSVRSPAAWTNCIGFRPSSGRLPGYRHSIADGSTSTAGVFARCVQDAVLFMEACDGSHTDSIVPYPEGPVPVLHALDKSDEKIRVAWQSVFSAKGICSEILSILNDQKKCFLEGGSIIDEPEIDFIDQYRTIYPAFNAFAQVKALPREVVDGYEMGKPTKNSISSLIRQMEQMSAKDLTEIFKLRESFQSRVQEFFDHYDVIISPTHTTFAFDASDEKREKLFDWADLYFAPLLGLPSVSVPMGFTADGMPCGLMITGPRGKDLQVLQVAYEFEQKTRYFDCQPDYGWA